MKNEINFNHNALILMNLIPGSIFVLLGLSKENLFILIIGCTMMINSNTIIFSKKKNKMPRKKKIIRILQDKDK